MTTRARPIGIAPGAPALIAAWLAALMIALLTGATAVVILLAAGVVVGAASLVVGALTLRRVRVVDVRVATDAVAGEPLTWRSTVVGDPVAHVELRVGDCVVAAGPMTAGVNVCDGIAPARGVHTTVEARWSSAGLLGLVWWRRRATLTIAPLFVAPALGADAAPVERATQTMRTGARSAPVIGRDEPDGVRLWRDGDEINAVHWPSSLRSGELIMRQRLRDGDERWTVIARRDAADLDAEASRVRRAVHDALAAGASVAVVVDGEPPHPIATHADAARWTAAFLAASTTHARQRWWRRTIRVTGAEPSTRLDRRARWAVALAGAAPLVMILEPLGYGPMSMAIVLAAVAFGATVSTHWLEEGRWQRQLIGLGVSAAATVSLIEPAQITSVATSLRYLLPQLLVGLVLLQGFECVDRRSARVGLGCAALLCAYSAGVRVDSRLAVWLLVAGSGIGWALTTIGRHDRLALPAVDAPSRHPRSRRLIVGRAAGLVGAAVATVALLAAVPVPRGPAQLTLPSWLESRRATDSSGALAAPDGSPLLGGASVGGESGGRSAGGSYAGFSPVMDTALRGDLGDEVVLRVRAPEPAFWRGQTYSTFDGRSWSLDDAAVGARTLGPEHRIFPADGDVRVGGDEFIQTFYAEVDLPNLIFAATSARRVLLDAPLWQRPDGALRADVVLPAGSAYTVISSRTRPTAQGLRDEGVLSGERIPDVFTQVPEVTTDRVRDLARSLNADSTSTFDTVEAIHAWLEANVEYTLDAPVPPDGADAVDHFLFESQLGFCEQIATATTIMLRTLGVPARVATGYVPSDRDEVAGVWISRARDAHAWVEVHFPNYGWVAFDPTASVPLAGEVGAVTIGGDLAKAIGEAITEHLPLLFGGAALIAILLSVRRALRVVLTRRRRGRWGLLQDRFVAIAVERGGDPHASNASLADVFDDADANALARAFDASAFAVGWRDDDADYARAATLVRTLESAGASARR